MSGVVWVCGIGSPFRPPTALDLPGRRLQKRRPSLRELSELKRAARLAEDHF